MQIRKLNDFTLGSQIKPQRQGEFRHSVAVVQKTAPLETILKTNETDEQLPQKFNNEWYKKRRIIHALLGDTSLIHSRTSKGSHR